MPAWPGIMVVLTALSLVLGCASSPYVGTGVLLGGGVGAVSGAAIGNGNPGAGAAIGGLIGTLAGAAGGYMIQQRRQPAPPSQGYYYQQPPSYGYGAPAPAPGYGYSGPPPGPGYAYNAPPPGPSYSYNAPAPAPSAPPAPEGFSEPPVAGSDSYSQTTPPQPEGCRTPMKYAPYYY